MLSYFVIKFDSFDADAWVRALQKHSLNGVILIWNYAGEISVRQCPQSIPLKSTYRYFTPGRWTENRWIKWTSLSVVLTWIMLQVFTRTKVDKFLFVGGDILIFVAQFFKKIGRINKTITVIEDWSLPKPTDDIFDTLNKFKLRLTDRLLTEMDITVIATPKALFEARNRYWKDRTLRNSVLVDNTWAWFLEGKRKRPVERSGSSICLLGAMRKNFGMEIIFALLPELNRELGVRLKIIGPPSPLYDEYKTLSGEMGIDSLIDWRGFVGSEKLAKELEDCFCGINIQELASNNSSFVPAGRLINYLQHYVVPVLSLHSGTVVQLVNQYKIGGVCEPTKDSVKHAIIEAYKDNTKFTENIARFLTENPYKVKTEHILNV